MQRTGNAPQEGDGTLCREIYSSFTDEETGKDSHRCLALPPVRVFLYGLSPPGGRSSLTGFSFDAVMYDRCLPGRSLVEEASVGSRCRR